MTLDTTLLGILLATALSGIGSMAGAAVLSLTVLSRVVDRMVSFSVGVLLATSLLHSLPEAFEAHCSPRCWPGCWASSCWKKSHCCVTRIIMRVTGMAITTGMIGRKPAAAA
jgi:zinc transporter ZupT